MSTAISNKRSQSAVAVVVAIYEVGLALQRLFSIDAHDIRNYLDFSATLCGARVGVVPLRNSVLSLIAWAERLGGAAVFRDAVVSQLTQLMLVIMDRGYPVCVPENQWIAEKVSVLLTKLADPHPPSPFDLCDSSIIDGICATPPLPPTPIVFDEVDDPLPLDDDLLSIMQQLTPRHQPDLQVEAKAQDARDSPVVAAILVAAERSNKRKTLSVAIASPNSSSKRARTEKEIAMDRWDDGSDSESDD